MTKITNQALINSALNQLWVFSLSSDFWAVFGTEYNRENAEILRSQWQIGDFSQLPEIEILDSSILGSANGAYSSSENRIYLSSNLMENGTSSKIREVLIEEIGHFVDSRINQIDTPGDEGEYFAGLVTDQKLNKDEIDRLKAEDDLVVVTIDGKGVEVEQNTSTGTIQGLKWNDINANGLREELIQGNTPDIVFVIDVSGSAGNLFGGSSVGDVNKDGQPNTRLDAEIAGFIALNNRLVGKGLDTTRISIVSFADSANQLDMDPTISGIQLTTNPGTDSNSNSIKDIEEVLSSLRDRGGTDFKQPLQKAADTLTSIGTTAGNGNVIFISDGEVSVVNYENEVLALQNAGVKLSAFGVGTNASIRNLQAIDPNASIFTSTDQLLNVFDGLGSGSQSFKEPGLAGVSIYIDSNNNGVLDTGEPTEVTAADNPSTTNIDETGQYSFTGVQPGTYIVREVVPSGFSQTFPNSPNYHSVNVASGQTVIKNFGNTTPPSITLAVNPVSVVEDGTANLVYTFTRTGNLTNAITVNYTVQETATFNTDYTQTGAGSFTSTSGTVTFAAGSRTTTVTLDPTDDRTVESDETVSLTLASGTGYTIGTAGAVRGIITNDDIPTITPNVDTPKVNISEGLIFTAQSDGNITLDTNRESATPDEVTNVQNGTKSNFNHIIGLYEVLNSQGEIKDDQGNTLKPGDANYALHALTTAIVKNFTVQAGGNDTPSTATQLGSGVSVFAGKSYAPFVIVNGGTYFPGSQGIEDFVAAEQGKIDRFSSKDQYVRDLVTTEEKDGDIFNNTPRFVQEPVAYFSFGAANPDGSPHFRSYGNGVYGFEDLPASFTQYSNNDFNDGVFALTLGI